MMFHERLRGLVGTARSARGRAPVATAATGPEQITKPRAQQAAKPERRSDDGKHDKGT